LTAFPPQPPSLTQALATMPGPVSSLNLRMIAPRQGIDEPGCADAGKRHVVFLGAKTQKGHLARRSGDTSCGLLAFLQGVIAGCPIRLRYAAAPTRYGWFGGRIPDQANALSGGICARAKVVHDSLVRIVPAILAERHRFAATGDTASLPLVADSPPLTPPRPGEGNRPCGMTM
jgi:hypothetical protein